MSGDELFNSVLDAENVAGTTDHFGKIKMALKKYQIAHCYRPRTLRVFVGISGEERTIQVPCGHCYHCLETKRNEWVTRAYAHAESFKNVYFVTLTYRSFYVNSLKNFQPHRMLIEYLSGAAWLRDSENTLKHDCYSPSVLCKKHYQDFLKRLRKNTGLNDITYMCSGEYGFLLGRPHFHLILFTNGVLTPYDVKRAWSLALVSDDYGNYFPARNSHRPKRWYSFGKVSFDDLVQNGSFDEKKQIRVDGRDLDARNCFAYVCKYLHKQEYNIKRVSKAYEVFKIVPELELLNRRKQPNLFTNNYEKTSFFKLTGIVAPDSDEFCRLFRPFLRVSLGHPIGSDYVRINIQDMAKGKFQPPALQAEGYVLPSYFMRKVSEYLFPFRKISVTAASSCFVKQNVPLQSLNFQKSLQKGSFIGLGFESSILRDLDFILRKSSFTFVDLSDRSRNIICYDVFGNVWVNSYHYSRSDRCYHLSREIPIREWIQRYLSSFEKEYERYIKLLRLSERNDYYYKTSCDLVSQYYDFQQITEDIVKELEKECKYTQQVYNNQHKHLE